MKKIFTLILFFVILIEFSAVSGEYITYYDVFDDIKLLFKRNPDTAWSLSKEEAKAVTESWDDFTCWDVGNIAMDCEKNHWSGNFQITLYFADEGNLTAVNTVLTGSTIRDLNYTAGTSYIYCVEDLVNRLKSSRLIPKNAPERTGESLFPWNIIIPYSAIYEIGDNTLLQAGYIPKSEEDPSFYIAFILREASEDFKFPTGEELTLEQLISSDFNIVDGLFLPKPNVIAAESEQDFYGVWMETYNYMADSPLIGDDSVTYIVRMNGDDEFGQMFSSIVGYQLHQIRILPGQVYLKAGDEPETGPVAAVFQAGKLITGFGNAQGDLLICEMNDNGMISTSISSGFTSYYVKQEDVEIDSYVNTAADDPVIGSWVLDIFTILENNAPKSVYFRNQKYLREGISLEKGVLRESSLDIDSLTLTLSGDGSFEWITSRDGVNQIDKGHWLASGRAYIVTLEDGTVFDLYLTENDNLIKQDSSTHMQFERADK